MTQDKLIGLIKSHLKLSKDPNLNKHKVVEERLTSAHSKLLKLDSTNREFQIVKVKLLSKTGNSIPTWFDSITQILSEYLDVIILRESGIVLGTPKVTQGYCILGDKPDALLASHYTDYLFTLVYKLSENKRLEVKNHNRKDRRRDRRVKCIDARLVASNFRDILLKDISEILKRLLALKKTNMVAWKNGDMRVKLTEIYLKQKYGPKWKTVVSTKST